MIWVGYKHLLCRCSFPIKYIKYDIMVNKIKIKYIYIFIMCVYVCERDGAVKQ